MGDRTGISWTEATWNPIAGCSVVSPGCTNCYAMREAGSRLAHTAKFSGLTEPSKAGPIWTGHVRFWESAVEQPLRWQKPRMIFVNSMSDLFHEEIPDQWIDEIHAVMTVARWHTFQILTKRPERMRDYYKSPTVASRVWLEVTKYAETRPDDFCDWMLMNRSAMEQYHENIFGERRQLPVEMILELPLPNVWVGVSVEDQRRADERIPILLETPAAVRWLSVEPQLEHIDLQLMDVAIQSCHSGRISWIVVGGESGPGARPFNIAWARWIVRQCKAANVPVFMKQLGANPYWQEDAIAPLPLRDRKGADPTEWPEDLRIREYPT